MTRTAEDFRTGQAVRIHGAVDSPLAGKLARVTSVDHHLSIVTVVSDGKTGGFDPIWLRPAKTAEDMRVQAPCENFLRPGALLTFIGQDGSQRPVTFIGYSGTNEALYAEGHITIRVTLADNIAI